MCTWRLLKTWHVNELPNRAPPFPLVVLQTLLGYSFFHQNFAFAVSRLVGFYGMLRTGEIFSLTSESLFMNNAHSPIVVSLGLTKSGKRFGAAECVTIQVKQVQDWVWAWKQCVQPRTKLVVSEHAWRIFFSQALDSLQLQTYDFRPYSLRRGGATFWFQKHGSFDQLLVAGRWRAASTARICLNEGLALLTELQIPRVNLQPFLNIFSKTTPCQLQKLEQTPLKRRRAGGRGKRKSFGAKKN